MANTAQDILDQAGAHGVILGSLAKEYADLQEELLPLLDGLAPRESVEILTKVVRDHIEISRMTLAGSMMPVVSEGFEAFMANVNAQLLEFIKWEKRIDEMLQEMHGVVLQLREQHEARG